MYTHVEKHSGDRAGHMKRYGCPLTPPDYMVPRGPRYEIDMKFWNLTHSKAAYYEVVPVMRNRSNGRDPWGAGYDFQERVEDHEVTLDMVWDAKKERNLSKGRCENTEIGIIHEYDLGGEFLGFRFQFNPLTCHHITLGHDNDLFTVAPPMNVPIVVEAKGAPPIEDAHCDIPGEIEPYDKTVNFLLYDEETFVKYCNGDVGTCARKTELAVFDKEEERQRVQEIQKQRQECERAEMEKVRERAARKARGEVSESDLGSEEDDRDADSDEDFY